MSSTRTAKKGSPLRQERYASDPAFNEALKASCVARKARLLTNPIHREICLYLQYASMQEGGLDRFVSDLLSRYGHRVGSKTMREHIGMETFKADIVRRVRSEIEGCNALDYADFADRFPLKGEWMDALWGGPVQNEYESSFEFEERMDAWRNEKDAEAAHHPESYPVQLFIDFCMEQATEHLKTWLVEYCLNPETTLANPPPWFYEIEQVIVDCMADYRRGIAAGQYVTALGEQINDALDYAMEERCMVHINGVARRGKTHQIKQWCDARPGLVRYVQVPAGQDDISFFREIAKSMGTAYGSALKATQIRQQIEDAIQDSGLMLVFDEAHLLWPQYKSARSNPRRITWLMTAVVNKGIPVALVSTEQFDLYQKAVVDGTGWASEQLDGRIAFRLDLPDELPDSDLEAIGRYYLPESDELVITWLAWFATASGKYLAGIEAAAKRARFLGRKNDRGTPTIEDLFNAMRQVEPRMANALEKYEQELNGESTSATLKQQSCKPVAQRMQKPIRGMDRVPRSRSKKLETVA